MNNAMKPWLIVGVCLILAGGIVFAITMHYLNWDFSKLSTTKYITNQHQITQQFQNISIQTDTEDLTFVPSESEYCTVTCFEEEASAHVVSVVDGTLQIQSNTDAPSWIKNIGINFNTSKITVALPQEKYASVLIRENTGDIELPEAFTFENLDISLSTGDITCSSNVTDTIKIKSTTGSITLSGISCSALEAQASTGSINTSEIHCAGNITLAVTTGKTTISNIRCQNLSSIATTGDLHLNDVIVLEHMDITRSTGDIDFVGTDAATIQISTNTGNVTGTLLSQKIFTANTRTGSVNVPNSTSGGVCNIKTSTGDIHIKLD